MAIDKRGRKLPKGIRQRGDGFEGRFMYEGKTYQVHGETVKETQKSMTELKYRLEHGMYVATKKITLNEWFETWMEDYKKNKVKIGTYTSYEVIYHSNSEKEKEMDYKKLIIEALQELDETRMKHIYYFIKGMKKNRK